MGMPYALMKRDRPEVFDLGKGSRMLGWPEVFERRYGTPLNPSPVSFLDIFGVNDSAGNFNDPLQSLDIVALTKRIEQYDNNVSGNPDDVAKRIIDWMGDDVCQLVNCWEEMEDMIRSRYSSKKLAEALFDPPILFSSPLKTYKQTGSVWG